MALLQHIVGSVRVGEPLMVSSELSITMVCWEDLPGKLGDSRENVYELHVDEAPEVGRNCLTKAV